MGKEYTGHTHYFPVIYTEDVVSAKMQVQYDASTQHKLSLVTYC